MEQPKEKPEELFGGGWGANYNPTSDLHGSARWLTREDARRLKLFDEPGVLLGQFPPGNELIYFKGDGNVMVFAPIGSGKGIGFVQANLADYPGSMVVLDPKGENAIVSAAHRRKMGQDVIVLDPFNKTGLGTTQYNPLGALSFADNASLGAMIEAIADALIPVTDDAKEPHWPLGAKKFVSFLLWFMLAHEPPHNRHLVRLFDLAHQGAANIESMARVMAQGLHPDPEVRRMCVALGNWFLGRQSKEFSYFESQVLNNLGWIGDSAWSSVLAAPPSPPLELKRKKTTVYLVLPFNRIERYQPWLRVMVADMIASLYDTPGALKDPVLFLLDEAYSGLGRMDSLFAAAAAVRSSGARLCFIYQDINQVQKLYGKAWASLIANSGVALFWSVNDLEAAQYISQFTGSRTVPVPGQTMGMGQPLIRPEQVMQLPADEIIALFRSAPPARFKRLDVLTDPHFNTKLAKNTTYSPPATSSAQPRAAREWVFVDLKTPSVPAPIAPPPSSSPTSPSEMQQMADVLSELHGQDVFHHPQRGFGYLDADGKFVSVA